MWRRTRTPNPFSPTIGVDPNRNYDYKWMAGTLGLPGAPDQRPGSDTYAGPYPLSEIENLLLTDAMLERKEHLKVMYSFHAYSQFWLLPYAYANGAYPPDYEEIRQSGLEQVRALTAVHGTSYRVGSPPDILYAASGGTLDFAKAKASVKFVYTPELRDTGRYGFILPPNQIIPSGQETFEAIRVMADTVHAKYGQ